jgi:predicted transposase/invertase (TIGR01784 family)
MKRDTLFFRIFKEFPDLLFDLTGNPPENASEYRFNSVAVKEPNFTIDGVFEPPVLDGTGKLYLAEVQMQLDEALCERTFAELFALFYRSRKLYSDWQCVMIYLSRSTEQKITYPYRALLESDQVQIIYLDELGNIRDLPLTTSLAVLPTVPPKKAPAEARDIIARAKEQPEQYKVIVDLVARVMSYMFIDQSPQEIDKMLDIQFEETRVYKDTYAKGKLDMALELLESNCGQLRVELVREVTALPISQLEALGKALLKFNKVQDLEKWLQENASATASA